MICSIYELVIKGRQAGDSIAIKGVNRQPMTYAKLREQIIYGVSFLNSLGYKQNDQVLVILPDGPEQAVALLSVAAGFTAIPLDVNVSTEEFNMYISDLAPKAIIVDEVYDTPVVKAARQRGIEVIRLVPQREKEAGTFGLTSQKKGTPAGCTFAEEDDISMIFFTSGTTEKPKIVPFKQRLLCQRAIDTVKTFDITDQDCNVSIMTLTRTTGFKASFFALILAGGTVVCTPGFDERHIIQWFEEYRPTMFVAVPALHSKVLRQISATGTGFKHHIRFIRSGSAALDPAMKKALETAFGVPVCVSYGSTESNTIALNWSDVPGKNGSVGRSTGPEIAFLDEEGRFLERGMMGEIVVRSPLVFEGYFNAPELNRSAFIGDWFRTGDLGYIDEDGYLFIQGRVKEMINCGGKKVSPFEVEKELNAHPSVAGSVAFKIMSRELDEVVGAAVVLKEGCSGDEAEMRIFVSERLSYNKVPSRIVFVEKIPVDERTGKYPRNRMTEMLGINELEAPTAPTATPANMVPPSTQVERNLIRLWEDALGVKPIDGHDDFFRMGGDSLKAANLIASVNRSFNLQLPLNTIFKCSTAWSMADFIHEHGSDSVHDPIVTLRPGESKLPLFCMPLSDINLMKYSDLANSLQPGRPVYGIQPAAMFNPDASMGSIEELAADIVKIIKSAQPTGPYYLCGYSYSGTTAFETARQLREHGDEIGFLGIIDNIAPGYDFSNLKKFYSISMFMVIARESPRVIGRFIRADTAKKVHIASGIRKLSFEIALYPFRSIRATLTGKENKMKKNLHGGWVYQHPVYIQAYTIANQQRKSRYYPKKYDGRITTFAAITREDLETRENFDYLYRLNEPEMGWKGLAHEVDAIILDGNHNTIMDMPYVLPLAREIDRHLH